MPNVEVFQPGTDSQTGSICAIPATVADGGGHAADFFARDAVDYAPRVQGSGAYDAKGIGHQTLLKMLVHEGLRREARRA